MKIDSSLHRSQELAALNLYGGRVVLRVLIAQELHCHSGGCRGTKDCVGDHDVIVAKCPRQIALDAAFRESLDFQPFELAAGQYAAEFDGDFRAFCFDLKSLQPQKSDFSFFGVATDDCHHRFRASRRKSRGSTILDDEPNPLWIFFGGGIGVVDHDSFGKRLPRFDVEADMRITMRTGSLLGSELQCRCKRFKVAFRADCFGK